MKRITVKACGECPFNYYDDRAGGALCAAADGAGYTPEDRRPEWCPLEQGPVTVAAEGGRCGELGPEGAACRLTAGHGDRHQDGRVSWVVVPAKWTGVRIGP